MIDVLFDDSNLVAEEMTVTAKVIQKFKHGKAVVKPGSVDLGQYGMSVTQGITGGIVGSCESIVLDADGSSVTAVVKFESTPLGIAAYRWFRSGLLWTFIARIEPRGNRYSLISLGIDPNVPIS